MMKFRTSMVGLGLLLLGFGCLAAFKLIGSAVDVDGFVKEPFWLLPTGWLLIVVGAVWIVMAAIRGKRTGSLANH
jgi:hypothetical protein